MAREIHLSQHQPRAGREAGWYATPQDLRRAELARRTAELIEETENTAFDEVHRVGIFEQRAAEIGALASIVAGTLDPAVELEKLKKLHEIDEADMTRISKGEELDPHYLIDSQHVGHTATAELTPAGMDLPGNTFG